MPTACLQLHAQLLAAAFVALPGSPAGQRRAQDVPLQMLPALQEGLYSDWDIIEGLWDHVFRYLPHMHGALSAQLVAGPLLACVSFAFGPLLSTLVLLAVAGVRCLSPSLLAAGPLTDPLMGLTVHGSTDSAAKYHWALTLHRLCRDRLRADVSEHPLLLAEPSHQPPGLRERMVEAIFEQHRSAHVS